jgi:hypothetical protein
LDGPDPFNRPSELEIGDLRGANRNDFIGHELLESNSCTSLMALDQTQSHTMFSNVLEHFLRIPNDETKAG